MDAEGLQVLPTPIHIAELERLGDEIAELSAHLDAATAPLLELIREFDARGGWNNGFRSCAAWLSWRIGLAPGAAREKVRVARALGTLPRLAQALARGELSYSKVRELTRVATPETEEPLLAVGRAGTAEHVERIVRGWRRVDRKAEAREASRSHARRALHVYQDEDGMVVIRGRLEPETGAVLVRALEAAREALYPKAHSGDVPAGTSGDVPAETCMTDTSTMGQLQAEPWPCSPRRLSTTGSIPGPRRNAIRSSSTSTLPCWRMPISPASRSSRTDHAFQLERPSAWRATRPGS